jgi:formate dehydrogenase major subunit
MNISRRSFLKGLAALTAFTGVQAGAAAHAAAATHLKTEGCRKVISICPYCGVGCGLTIYEKDGKIINLEGDKEHPINEGALCSKGNAVMEIYSNPLRLDKVRYRAPGTSTWQEKDISWAMKEIAKRIKATRDASFIRKLKVKIKGKDGKEVEKEVTVNRTEAIASLGSAAIGNEENYLIQKLMRSLGVVYLEHCARL